MNLDELYRQVIMDNYKNPKNKGLIKTPDYRNVHLTIPSCGDKMYVSVKVNNNTLEDIKHDGEGCSICCASASVASEVLKNKNIEKAQEMINDFYELVKGNEVDNEDLDEAFAFQSVSKFPARIKCATLAWKCIEEAINGDDDE